jgi:hypothetical protein
MSNLDGTRWLRAAPDPELRKRRCRVGAGLESAQREVVQGGVNDGVGPSYSGWSGGTCPSRLRNTVSVRARSSGTCGGAGDGVVSSGSMFGSTQKESSGESKNWPGKMSGEPNTV